MSKIGLIIKREYITRVRKKSFIIISLLAPIGIILMLFLPALIEMFGSTTKSSIAVIDRTNFYSNYLQTDQTATFTMLPTDIDEEETRQSFDNDGFDAYMIIEGSPAIKDSVRIYSNSTLTMDLVSKIERDLKNGLREQCIANFGEHSAQVDSVFQLINSLDTNVTTINITQDGSDSESSAIVGFIVSFIVMFLIYTFVLTSGSMVMASVMEEKNSRIIEVLVSSVRPFDLMMGKIIGIALTTLTQFAIWFVVGCIISIGASIIMPTPDITEATEMAAQVDSNMITKVFSIISSINFVKLIVLFFIYFIGGYLLYASFFACIGAAVENHSEGQQLMLPLTLLIVMALYLAIYAAKDPNGTISIVGSIIPFTSPIVMMARIPFGVPTWQIIVSIVVLIASFALSTWIAARIYRVGILMYGKKVTFKEMWRWFKQSN